MKPAPRLAAAIAALGALTTAALAQPAPGTILDIDAQLHGDWTFQTDPSFVPASQDGHHGLDTLVVSEHVPGFVEDNPMRQIPDGPGARPAERWADLWVTVFRESSDDAAMIAIDKGVFNWTPHHWTDFHMELGVIPRGIPGVGDLIGVDGLDFKRDPAPSEETGKFGPAMFGEGASGAPSLWWFAGGAYDEDREIGAPGVWPQESAQFWLGLTVPDSLFEPVIMPGRSESHEIATFLLRQHWTPTPGAAGAFALAGLAALRRRRDQ